MNDPGFHALLTSCHLRLVGTPLGRPEATGEWLYEDAPFGLLAHDASPDPLFTYANRTAQRCFEYGWEEFVGMPSRLSALPGSRESRQELLDAVAGDGYATGYRGLRVAKSGRRFWVEDLTMWNLLGADGALVGQAAAFHRWRDA
ncbi:MEKHLA domain-containing protein [Microbispora corallina]|uniref:MEKHLA domain-containing protein n=1 Tax=Microbispora corallina TaxID=83302 RepID=A0ABQ4GAS7_9ACTN|nr:MEKHLA domain-containing protein [Microbispora corallina]GIH44147.1 MEKHLA domain-containing protein [Microbispora corallina]